MSKNLPETVKKGLQAYYLIKEQRGKLYTTVDVIGCSSYYSPNDDNSKLSLIISLILSAQTKDETVFLVLKRLNDYLKYKNLEETIKKSNFKEISLCVNSFIYFKEIIAQKEAINGDISAEIEFIKELEKCLNVKYNNLDKIKYLLTKIKNFLSNTTICEKKIEKILESYKLKDLIKFNYNSISEVSDNVLETKNENLITLENLKDLKLETLVKIISLAGFPTKKAKSIEEIINLGKIPETKAALEKIKGIGSKISTLYFQTISDKYIGISVDTHVHRISNLLGIIESKTPEKSQKLLEKIVEREEFPHFNKVLVGFGQRICSSKKRRCEICAAKKICSSSKFLEF